MKYFGTPTLLMIVISLHWSYIFALIEDVRVKKQSPIDTITII